MTPKKLDKRFSGYKNFKYCLDFKSIEGGKFVEVRNWCWNQWGPSTELDLYYKISEPNTHWCWQYDEWKTRLYLATDKEYQWFILKWQ